ncbi:MAG TPA: hypothetical protein VGL93_00105 [Streptosporangiaceae bacterium]|jgi:hypothetical protein
MDRHEFAQRAQRLPDMFAARLTADDLEDVRDAIRAGEWDVGLSNLVAALSQTAAPITAHERAELAALLDAIGEPAVRLDALRVQG